MSTILKSLKKLEQEKEASLYTGPKPTYSRPGSMADTAPTTKWIVRGSLTLVIMGLVATSFYFYRQSRSTPHLAAVPEHQTSKRVKIAVAKREQTTVNKFSSPVDGPDAGQIREGAPPSMQAPEERANAFREEPAVHTGAQPTVHQSPPGDPAADEVVSRNAPPQKTLAATTQTSRPIPGENREPEEAAPVKEAEPGAGSVHPVPAAPESSNALQHRLEPNPPKDPYADVSPMADNRLKVHAIVWSSEKEDRMAVVNTLVVHEGDTVAGFTIIAIRQDDLIVREQGRGMWLVRFGRP